MEVTQNNIGISHHPMFPPYHKQAHKQGFKYDIEKLAPLEKCRDAIFGLSMHGILTDAQIESCYKKLHKKVVSSICKSNNIKVRKEFVE